MKSIKTLLRIGLVALLTATCGSMLAQNSLPAPGTGGSSTPPLGQNGIGWNPGPGAFGPGPGNGPMWGGANMYGGPWYDNSWYQPTVTTSLPSQGKARVIACGYDATGVWRLVPLIIQFQYDGVQYDVTVLNAWNPWTDMWNRNVNQPAYNTDYWLRNIQYDYYVPLATGTYYFNL